MVLEWLGLVEPERSRREPVAVPGWAPYAVAVTLVVVAAAGAVVLRVLLGLAA